MRHLNSSLDETRARLAADVAAWVKRGRVIPLVPIMRRDASPDKVLRSAKKGGRAPPVLTQDEEAQILRLNKECWSRTNIGKRLKVSRETVTRVLKKHGVVK